MPVPKQMDDWDDSIQLTPPTSAQRKDELTPEEIAAFERRYSQEPGPAPIEEEQ